MITITMLIGIAVSTTAFIAYKKLKSYKPSSTPMNIIRSSHLDKIYVGWSFNLDPSFKYLLPANTLFEFPSKQLTVKSINQFDIDSNQIEVVSFDKLDGRQYIIVHDSVEYQTYFMQEIMVVDHSQHSVENKYIVNDNITLSENNVQFDYVDFSGLIDIQWRDHNNNYLTDKLIRMYKRATLSIDEVMLILEHTDLNETIYIGFPIEHSQLENV